MTDRELLELAAKAYWGDEIDDVCSIEWGDEDHAISYTHADNQDHNGLDCAYLWDPLTDDGDSLRLAVALNIHVRMWSFACEAEDNDGRSTGLVHASDCGGSVIAATRRAIVRAAAEIGKAME